MERFPAPVVSAWHPAKRDCTGRTPWRRARPSAGHPAADGKAIGIAKLDPSGVGELLFRRGLDGSAEIHRPLAGSTLSERLRALKAARSRPRSDARTRCGEFPVYCSSGMPGRQANLDAGWNWADLPRFNAFRLVLEMVLQGTHPTKLFVINLMEHSY